MSKASSRSTEIIVFCSGKGGTGKTSLISSLAYALDSSGLKVMLIDADRATDGLSLFVLGPEGRSQLESFTPDSTFTGLLDQHRRTGTMTPTPKPIFRTQDHGRAYQTIISDRYLYGEMPQGKTETWSIDRQYERETFREAVTTLFDNLRSRAEYDYVLVDSRGGFSFESTDIAAAADSFIVVTEATYTNFYQDRNLVDRISKAAEEMRRKLVMRAIIVNKSTDPPELSYRNELVREFGVAFDDTYAVSIDFDALRAYKEQKAIYRTAPASQFAYDSLRAFQRILRVVTSQWSPKQVAQWDALAGSIDAAIAAHNERTASVEKLVEAERKRLIYAEAEVARLDSEFKRERAALQAEHARQSILLDEFRRRDELQETRAAHELKEARLRALNEAEAKHETKELGLRHETELQIRTLTIRNRMVGGLALVTIAILSFMQFSDWYSARRLKWQSNETTEGTPTSQAFPMPAREYSASRPLPASSPTPMNAPATGPSPNWNSPTVVPAENLADQPQNSLSRWFRGCPEGTHNVIVASGYPSDRAAATALSRLQDRFPQFEFRLVDSIASDQVSNPQLAIFAGAGLSMDAARDLSSQLVQAGVVATPLTTIQNFNCSSGGQQKARK
jgi:MinD-like ATPase involved in chromosome partitioning or flagellar assembly